MPLSNTNYFSSAASGNIVENWIVQLGFYNGDAQGSGEGGWDAVLDTDGDANLINYSGGSELVTSGSNLAPNGNWTVRDADGSSTGWSGANPPVFGDLENSSLVNALTGAKIVDGLSYTLTFTVGVATMKLAIGGGDLSGNSADETYVASATYTTGIKTVTFQASADATHLWFSAVTVGSGNGTINTVSLKATSYASGETSIVVDDGTVFQDNDYIKIDSEIIQITTISTHTLTVVRGQMGTTAAVHTNNTALYWNNFLPVAFADTTVDSVSYRGVIAELPSIRTSINLADSTAKTGNVALKIINFKYKGDELSAELFLGTRKYINREVRIYSQLNGESTLSNCLQIYNGRLIDIFHDDSNITLQLTEKRPWDFITIPQNKSSTGIYEPVVYGDYTKNTHDLITPSASFLTSNNLFPLPSLKHSQNNLVYFIYPQAYGSNAEPHYYDRFLDEFIPFDDTATATASFDNSDTVGVPIDMERGSFVMRPLTATGAGWSNTGDAINTDTADASQEVLVAIYNDGNPVNSSITFDMPSVDGELTVFNIYVRASLLIYEEGGAGVDAQGVIYLTVYGSDTSILNTSTHNTLTWTGNETVNNVANYHVQNYMVSYGNQKVVPNTIGIKAKAVVNGTSTNDQVTVTVNLYDVIVQMKLKNNTLTEPTAAHDKAASLDFAYSGVDGFDNSFTGGSNVADTGLEAHRDMLVRFTGFDAADSSIYNWDTSLPSSGSQNIESLRITTAWNIRWWALEPVELEKVLRQLQYEFCFIFKWRADGSGSYWVVKDSYSSGDVVSTLNIGDIENLQINNTPFSELLTQIEINYERHPTGKRYMSSQTSKDATNNPRKTWVILEKENISEVNLDMNVNKPGGTDVGAGDTNDGFANYYMNIFGDIKKIINCDIVNPAKGYKLETGDIVKFSETAGEMPVDPFGDNWADYYMVTDLNRSAGKVKITCREVG